MRLTLQATITTASVAILSLSGCGVSTDYRPDYVAPIELDAGYTSNFPLCMDTIDGQRIVLSDIMSGERDNREALLLASDGRTIAKASWFPNHPEGLVVRFKKRYRNTLSHAITPTQQIIRRPEGWQYHAQEFWPCNAPAPERGCWAWKGTPTPTPDVLIHTEIVWANDCEAETSREDTKRIGR